MALRTQIMKIGALLLSQFGLLAALNFQLFEMVTAYKMMELSLKSLNKSAYQNKIKKRLLDVLNCEDDYIEVSKLIKHFATLT